MTDPTQHQLERLARAVWPASAQNSATIFDLMLMGLKTTTWNSIGTVLVWLAKEYDKGIPQSGIVWLLLSEDPKAAILKAAIEWQERNNQ